MNVFVAPRSVAPPDVRVVAASPLPAPRAAAAADAETERWRAWDAFVARTEDAGFMQSSWWADLRRTRGWRHSALVIKHAGTIYGGAIVLKRTGVRGACFYYVADGPVLSGDAHADAQVMRAVMRGLDAERANEPEPVSHLRIEPRWTRLPAFIEGFREVGWFMQPRTTLCIDLRPSPDELLARMKPKGRYNANLARRHGVTVVEDASPRGVDDFAAIYGDTMRRHGLRGVTPEYLANLMPLVVHAGHGSIFFAEYQGRRLATALVVYFGRYVTYLFGGSLTEHRNVMAPYLLHVEIMRRARELGHECYDLYGGVPDDQPDHPWNEISVFKRKLGARDVSFVPTLDYVYDEDAYARFRARESEAARTPTDMVQRAEPSAQEAR